MQVVAVDIGGTHARFAIADIEDGRVISLGAAVTLKTAEHASLQAAWQAFAAGLDRPVPKAVAIAVASPITGDVIQLTNNRWVVEPPTIPERLGAERWTIINDFGAIGHAVAQLPAKQFDQLCGPNQPLAAIGVTTVCGPGTGLGVAQVFKTAERHHVLSTEGGHVEYAPLDAIEDAIVKRLRKTLPRVSTERVCSGPAIVTIYETLAELKGYGGPSLDDKAIWTAALAGTDPIAIAALDRFCQALGSVSGDLALAHGANGVVIAGGLGLRLKNKLIRSGFAQRFVAKGRFQAMMAALPVKLVTHPQPGLFGAAAAFAQEHSS